MYLVSDYKNKWVTAFAGDEVELVGDHVNVMIVKAKDGARFSIPTQLLTDVKPDTIDNSSAAEITQPVIPVSKKKQPLKSSPKIVNGQQSFF